MNFTRRNPKTLAIIGNGFDLNHGYKTDYGSFAEKVKDPSLEKFNDFCEMADIEKWFDFEENIRIISEKLFLKSMSENCDFEDNRKEVKELTEVFKKIHILLEKYLEEATSLFPVRKKECIEKYLNKNTVAFNFNYTKTAEAYTDDIVYVHGSLEENDIILGYDYRDEPCLAQFEDMQWSKSICRESLAFRRHFLGKKKYDPNSEKFQTLISGLYNYHHWENTGRGLDDEVIKFIPNYGIIHKFLKKYRNDFFIPDLKYKNIETLVILGHGIKADRVFLQEILKKCVNLDKIVIYKSSVESDATYNEKVSFFVDYCANIEKIDY